MARGVRAFKPKIGGDPDEDAARLRAIREAVGPDVAIRADANQGYRPKEAIRLCRLAERFDVSLELLEQPVDPWDLQGMAAVRRSVDTLIEADESCYSIHDAMQVVRHEAADVLYIKLGKAGGLSNAKKIAAIVEASGLRCVIGTAFGLGPEIAAKLHLAASTMTVVDAVEFTELRLHGNLLAPPHDELLAFPLTDGCLTVPWHGVPRAIPQRSGWLVTIQQRMSPARKLREYRQSLFAKTVRALKRSGVVRRTSTAWRHS